MAPEKAAYDLGLGVLPTHSSESLKKRSNGILERLLVLWPMCARGPNQMPSPPRIPTDSESSKVNATTRPRNSSSLNTYSI
jgi:hypothetical protein